MVCISILHEPGDDQYGYEDAGMRWLPIHTIETILISVISMLADPNDESPANVEAAVCNKILNLCFVKDILPDVANPRGVRSSLLDYLILVFEVPLRILRQTVGLSKSITLVIHFFLVTLIVVLSWTQNHVVCQ